MSDNANALLQESHSIMEKWWNKMNEGGVHPEELNSFLEDADKAKDIIDQVLKNDANNEEAQDALLNWHLAVARLKAGFKDNNQLQEEAAEHMKVVVSLCPNDASFRGMLAECYKNLGKKELAMEGILHLVVYTFPAKGILLFFLQSVTNTQRNLMLIFQYYIFLGSSLKINYPILK